MNKFEHVFGGGGEEVPMWQGCGGPSIVSFQCGQRGGYGKVPTWAGTGPDQGWRSPCVACERRGKGPRKGGTYVTCDCPMASWAVITWRLPCDQNERWTELKTLFPHDFFRGGGGIFNID